MLKLPFFKDIAVLRRYRHVLFLCPNGLLSKSHYPPTGYSGYIDELTNHTYTFDNSFASVCALQMGAFLRFLKNFFKKFLKTNVHFEMLRFEGLRKGDISNFTAFAVAKGGENMNEPTRTQWQIRCALTASANWR